MMSKYLPKPNMSDDYDDYDGAASCLTPCSVGSQADIASKQRERSLKTEWLDSLEAAMFLRISVRSLRNMTSNGQVPFYKLGRRNRYRRDELEAQLLSQKRGKHGN